jgi:DNA invertase Pin-like site-specific DNA recombinase
MSARRKAPPPDHRAPIAISYIRFSGLDQRKGDSKRRQTEASEAWCRRHDVNLDRALVDAGKSAYHGRHRDDKAALGRFLELAKGGMVPRGSFLIIENLDRLSREDERTALRLWLDILDAGINIVQLAPETVFRHDRSDMLDVMRAIIELSRGHSESRAKAMRAQANWNKAVERAREGEHMTPRRADGRVTRSMTGRLPGWVEDVDGVLRLVPERAAVVRNIFEWARSGLGVVGIVRRLTREKVPPFGDRVPDGEGHHRQADGSRLGCGQWRRGYIWSILRDRRALGELQPRDRDRQAKGGAIANYYPPCIDEGLFFAAQNAVAGRKQPRGRVGEGVGNLWSGLLFHARDGEAYYLRTRGTKAGRTKHLLNRTSIEGQARAYVFDYATFEAALLSLLREVSPEEVDGGAAPAPVAMLEGELAWVRERRALLAAELLKGDVVTIAEALRALEPREVELAQKVEQAKGRAAATPVASWQATRSLMDVLASAEDVEDVRLRLRGAFRRLIESVHLLVVPRGRDRLCAVQVRFTESSKCRDYLVLHRPGLVAFGTRRAGTWQARSFSAAADPGKLDLREPGHAQRLEKVLLALPLG